jgi:protein-S-isoprenylcysteine O-methyltransferase Ste14
MKIAAPIFHFRALVFVLLYLLGFFPPWGWGVGNASNSTAWLASSTLLARSGWISLAAATVMVTSAALACLLTGTVLRVWGTAMQDFPVREPLYLGTWWLACGASILMPPGGAGFFLVAFSIFVLFLAYNEERFLSVKLGPRTKWAQVAFAETYPIGFTVCFAVFAWRYNARVLIQCLLICYGLSLVARAFTNRSAN